MMETLENLPATARILDLGCASGSFAPESVLATTVRCDIKPLDPARRYYAVQGDAASLPFNSAVFDAVVCNHSLEHFQHLSFSLREIGRVLKPGGFLFISVPDANTVTDRIYRWLARGGGHVNQFRSAEALVELVCRDSAVSHAATKTLCTSFSFMNRKNPHPPQPKRMVFFMWGMEWFLVTFNFLLRMLDRCFKLRTSVFGWALYFGTVAEPISNRPCVNVCVRCGQGHPSEWLRSIGSIRGFPVRFYRCPVCGTRNFFVRDECYSHLYQQRVQAEAESVCLTVPHDST